MTPEREAVIRGGYRDADVIPELLRELDATRAERDAYKRAKSENDERFMIERDEARAALRTAEERDRQVFSVLSDLRAWIDDDDVELPAPVNHRVWDMLADIDHRIAALYPESPSAK